MQYREPDLRPDVVLRCRPLDKPSPVWCETHALPCALVQHFVLTVSLNGEPEAPLTTLTIEGHMA